METKQVIEERRSIRNFKNENISKEVVEDILNCGRLAPSAKNRQNWYFVVLKNTWKEKVADLMIEYTKSNYGQQNFSNSIEHTTNVIKQAPILVLIFRKKDDNWIISDNLSIGACIENMCLRATDLGVGSLWIRDIVYVADEVSSLLKHEDMELNCAVSLGIPNGMPKPKPRKELKDIMEWYE